MSAYHAVRGQLIPIKQLFAARGAVFHDASWEGSHYNSGAAVIHYIFHGEGNRLRARFDQFAGHFSRRANIDTISFEAWANTFPDFPVEGLDNRVKDHMRNVFQKAGGKCLAIPFREPPEPDYKVEPADMALVQQRESWLKANKLRLRW